MTISVTDQVEKIVKDRKVKNTQKLSKQQKYYNRLVKKGKAKKETYTLSPLGLINK